MSEDEKIIEDIKEIINRCKECKFATCEQCEINWTQIKTVEHLLDLYNKEKEENKYYEQQIKQKENIENVKICMTHNLPNDAEIVCMIREDFKRNFGNDYVSKDRIRELKDKFIKYSKDEKVFMTQSSQINASLIQFCNELLEERN